MPAADGSENSGWRWQRLQQLRKRCQLTLELLPGLRKPGYEKSCVVMYSFSANVDREPHTGQSDVVRGGIFMKFLSRRAKIGYRNLFLLGDWSPEQRKDLYYLQENFDRLRWEASERSWLSLILSALSFLMVGLSSTMG